MAFYKEMLQFEGEAFKTTTTTTKNSSKSSGWTFLQGVFSEYSAGVLSLKLPCDQWCLLFVKTTFTPVPCQHWKVACFVGLKSCYMRIKKKVYLLLIFECLGHWEFVVNFNYDHHVIVIKFRFILFIVVALAFVMKWIMPGDFSNNYLFWFLCKNWHRWTRDKVLSPDLHSQLWLCLISLWWEKCFENSAYQ